MVSGTTIVDAKSNEITAIPKLLQMLEVSGCLVTIDAMGCQTEIAREIINAGADYVLAVKGNQPTLHEGIKAFFDITSQTTLPAPRHDIMKRRKRDMGEKRIVIMLSVLFPRICPIVRVGPN